MKFSEATELLLPFVDALYEEYENSAKSKLGSTTCFKGCGACCHFPIVPATAGEAFVLLGRLLATGKSIDELHVKFFKYVEVYRTHIKENEGMPFTDAQQRAFLSKKLPCPLFIKDGKSTFSGHCSVFGARPLICEYFHSTDSPTLCESKSKHGAYESVMNLGDEAVETVRIYERTHFGRSALGHLPLLLAALTTQNGLEKFLDVKRQDSENWDAELQSELDFEFYRELLSCVGIEMTVRDIESLLEAQQENAT